MTHAGQTATAGAAGRDEIAEFIRQQIMRNELSFGQKISEAEIAARFGVSRTPVREAIVTLSCLGLIDIKPRSGTYVVSFSKNSLEELFSARLILETGGVRHASAPRRAALVTRLQGMMPSLTRQVSDADTFDQFSDVDTVFHTSLVEACGNARLREMYRPIEICAQAARSRLDKTAGVAESANDHHAAIVEALARDDIDRFERVLRDHLAWVLGMLMGIEELFTR